MFNFIKKGVEKEEKDKRKREKDGKKKRERGSMTAEELLRLDEMRRSLKIRGRKKEKEKLPSGITADYSENFFGDLERDPEFRKSGSLPGHSASKSSPSFNRGELSTQSDSSEASLNSLTTTQAPQKVLPPLPPRPPKRGILKGSKTNVMNPEYYENHDPNLLVRNTLQNEVIISQNNYSVNVNNFQRHINANVQHSSNLPPECSGYHSQSDAGMSSSKNNLLSITSTSLSAESLTDTTNSSFATPPFSLSPVGESYGFSKMQSRIDEKNIDAPLPEITQFKLPSARELTIFRTSRGDFGFQLRRAIVTDKLSKTNKKTVIFAEPGMILSHKNETGLLPGDVLLEVNGTEVHDKSREDIIDMIKNSNSNVLVKVQPIPELCELIRRCGVDGQEIVLDDSNIRSGTLRRSGSLRFKKTGAKSDEELASERASLDNEKLWLVHKSGFTAVRILSDSSSLPTEIGKVKVKLEDSDTVLEVDEDDLEKANPPQLDRVEDLCQLRYINESSILYLLRQRYGNNLIHTYSAGNLIIVNPQCTLSIYNDKVAALFRGCKSEDMPPHIYALAQTTYRSLLSTRKDQSIILIGRSGSGKTHNLRHILSYLLHCAGSVNKILNVERLNALNTVVEAFGNARTSLNLNATRCTNLINMDFDQSGQIASLSLQILMLEKQRIAKRPDGEAIFNVFYWLLMGAEGSLAKQLLLDSSPPNNNLFVTSLYKNEDRQRAVMEFTKLTLALKALEISEKECFVVWSIIAVIYHLGHAGVVQVGTNKWQFADPIHASKAARLFGTTSEELSQAIWDSPVSPTKAQSSSDKDKPVTGLEALEGFVVGLYSELVTLINSLINRCLTHNIHSAMSIIIVDSPGFQNPASCGQQREANFSDLCHNYVQERLHLLFHNVNLIAPRDRYTQERIDLNMDEIYTELKFPIQLISILDKSPPSGVLKTSQTDLREVDRRGLLWLLEEESIYPNSSDETFIDRLFQHYGCKDHQMYIRRGNCAGHLVIRHFQGTNPVTYNAQGWLKASKENPINRVAINFLQESTKEEIRELFSVARGLHIGVGDGSQSLRRVSSIKRTCPSAVKRKSVSLQIKFMTDGLIETLRRTRPRFVFCMLAHHNAGLTDLLPGAANENIINVPLLRSQVRGAEILPATRMYKQGFPEYVPHGEFKRRFRLLAPSTSDHPEPTVSGVTIVLNGQAPATDAIDEAREVEEMLMLMDVDITMYRIGLTQVFFRVGVLAQLESQRDEKLADLIIQFQSRCRGYLARKKLAKLKVQDLAVRCIQKNVRKLMQVREWPWWRLYVKVTPLLNVHRTEEELTARLQELETLKSKMEKLESERNQLKMENDKLETKTEARSVAAMGSRESVNFRTNGNYEGLEKGIGSSEELPKRGTIVEKNENYGNKINVSLKNESTRKNVISSQQIIASENNLKNSVALNNYINLEKRTGNQNASGSEKRYENSDADSLGKDIGNKIKASENTESIFLKGSQTVNGNPVKTDIASGTAHSTSDPQNTKSVNVLQEKKEIKTNNLRKNGKHSSFTENPEAFLPHGKSGKKNRRESAVEKSATKSTEISLVNVSRPRSVSIVTLPSVTNIHEKIHTLTSGGTKTPEFKAQPKIHKLEDKLLTIGKEEPKKNEIHMPLTRGPNKIDPALQSKILKFGTPSVGSKLPRRQSAAKSSASKTDRVPMCNGYSVKNIEVGTSTSNEENLVAEENGDDSSITTLSGSLKITLNQATDLESNAKRETEKLVNDVILVRNQIEKLTRSTESFVEEKKELLLCRNQEQGHSVNVTKENVERVVSKNKEKIKTTANRNDKGSISWSNSEERTSEQCARETGPTPSQPKLQGPALPLPEIVDIKELNEEGRLKEIKNNNSPEEINYSSEGVLVTLAATNDPVKVGEPKLFITDSESRFESKSCEFPCEKMEAEEVCLDFSRGRSPFSPFSLLSDSSFEHYIPSVDFGSGRPQSPLRSSSLPRRIFPQTARRFTCESDDFDKEDSPVIIDAGISFDLVRKTSIRQQFKPKPAFAAPKTTSNSLSGKISEFLSKTDHVMEEWNRIAKSKSNIWQSFAESRDYPKMRSKSATNIMIKGVLNLAKHQNDSLRSRPVSRNSFSNISDIDELNEINADLSEERATGTLQAERLEAETAERVRLEQELSQVQEENKNLLQTSEKLEMELFYARADVNGLSEGEAEGEDGGGDATIYKQKCERAMRELEFTRRRLQQQHEDDLEQLVALKKQLEKKLADAYEEVDEQRQVAAQWKRKVQKFQSEMNDVRLLLEEQSSRNNLLEKKQRKFDSEIQLLQDELRSERNQKERLSREKDMAFAEKYAMEQNLSSVRLELELKEEKLSALSREVEELTRGGGSEQEVTQLRKAKHDLELKLKEQEEELDELAGQVSMLEGTKLRLEMSLESLRKELRREMSQREDELDEVRSNSQKKLKALEAQLENEHEERTLLLREKHELERRLNDVEERGRHHRAADEDALLRLRRDLKKTKALLRDAQMMLERAKQDSPSKAALRALKNQLEDAELARASAVKAKQSLESELNEVNGQLEELIRAKGDSENRCQAAQRECNALRTQVDENEEELAELLKKYRQTVQQLSAEQLASQETAGALAEAEAERASLRDQLAELTAKLEASTLLNPVSGMAQKRLEIRVKELESRLELEQTTRSRLEVQITRLKENVERLTEECIQARNKEQTANDLTRKLQRSLREAKEEMAQQQAKDQESAHKRKELEKRLETAEQEAMTARTDLRLAVKRIEDLQSAMSGEIASDSDRTDSEEDDSGDESLMLHFPSSLSSSRGSKTPDLSPR